MKTYQALRYRNYYAQDESGNYVLVTRSECFAPSEQPTEANPFKQRRFYDFEAGYAVRLSRDENGELIGKRNGADLKAKERQFTKDKECVLKDTSNCVKNCELCNREHTSRLLVLDEQWLDNSNFTSEITDTSNPADIFEGLELREELHKALSTLSNDEQKLIAVAFSGLSERDSAKELGLARKTFTYRRDRLIDRLKNIFNNSKNFFAQNEKKTTGNIIACVYATTLANTFGKSERPSMIVKSWCRNKSTGNVMILPIEKRGLMRVET